MISPYTLYLVTDEHQDDVTLIRVIQQAIAGGVTTVQLREKHRNNGVFLRRAQLCKSILAGSGVPFIINDNLDVALAVDADGLHIGQSDLPVEQVRKLWGDDKILGLTVENVEQLAQAQQLPIDYLGISTVFASSTKKDTLRPWGIAGLRAAVTQSYLPLVAIGGINLANIEKVSATGVAGIALVSAICHAADPQAASAALLKQMHRPS